MEPGSSTIDAWESRTAASPPDDKDARPSGDDRAHRAWEHESRSRLATLKLALDAQAARAAWRARRGGGS